MTRAEDALAPHTPVEVLIALGRRLGAISTPTWFLQDGQRYSGALPLHDIRPMSDAASSRR